MKFAFLLLMCLLAAPALSNEDQPLGSIPHQLSGEELAREITGNTLTGIHSSGMPYSEYHAPDGRIYGQNNNVSVRDGCWAVRRDEVCYSYEQGPATGIFCWRFYRTQGGYTIFLPATGTVGTAKFEQGNPHNHSDGGKPWSCNALLSMR